MLQVQVLLSGITAGSSNRPCKSDGHLLPVSTSDLPPNGWSAGPNQLGELTHRPARKRQCCHRATTPLKTYPPTPGLVADEWDTANRVLGGVAN